MAVEIEKHCQTVLDIINERDWKLTNPNATRFSHEHIATEFQGKLDQSAYTLSFPEQVEFWRLLVLEHPRTRFDILGVDTIVHHKDRTADVVLRTIMSKGTTRLLFACELKWKFTRGRWMLYSHRGMRGMPVCV